MVVETERDALMLRGHFYKDGWAFLGAGSASARPCRLLHPLLKEARILAVSMDGDHAGLKSWRFLAKDLSQGHLVGRCRRPWGKDPGDEAVERGQDLGLWLKACEDEMKSA